MIGGKAVVGNWRSNGDDVVSWWVGIWVDKHFQLDKALKKKKSIIGKNILHSLNDNVFDFST